MKLSAQEVEHARAVLAGSIHEVKRARAVKTAELEAALAALRHEADPAHSPAGYRGDARRRDLIDPGGAPSGAAGDEGNDGSTTRAQAIDLEEIHRAVGIPDTAIGLVRGALDAQWVDTPGYPAPPLRGPPGAPRSSS